MSKWRQWIVAIAPASHQRTLGRLDEHVAVRQRLPLVNTYTLDPWAALGDPTRRSIFARIAAAPRAVCEVAETLPVSRPAVSQHLKILKDAGLVLDERAGSRRIYRVNRDGLNRMRAELDSFWNDTLLAYKQLVEQPDPADATGQP
jgi:DNA-binding transcriptional ArsR family regulator